MLALLPVVVQAPQARLLEEPFSPIGPARRLQSDICADLDGNDTVNVEGASLQALSLRNAIYLVVRKSSLWADLLLVLSGFGSSCTRSVGTSGNGNAPTPTPSPVPSSPPPPAPPIAAVSPSQTVRCVFRWHLFRVARSFGFSEAENNKIDQYNKSGKPTLEKMPTSLKSLTSFFKN